MIRSSILTVVLALSGLSVSAPAQARVVSSHAASGDVQTRVVNRRDRADARPQIRERVRSPRLEHRDRARSHAPRRAPVARRGYWKTVRERVWVPGYWETVTIPAEWGFRFDACGVRVRYCVRPARCERVWRAGCWRHETRRVWVPRRGFRGHRR